MHDRKILNINTSVEITCNAGVPMFDPGSEDALEKGIATHSSILGAEFHEQTIFLAGYSTWGHKESNTTE